MPVIQVNNQQYSLKVGTTLVGSGSEADVPVPGHEALGVQAVVEVGPDRSASIRRASPSAVVRVNGVALGVEPTPLLHGDRVEVAGQELLFAEDHRAGATQYLQTHEPAATAPHFAGPEIVTPTTGGRLVSLVDGREYTVASTGIVIGRDAGCDVVVPSADVANMSFSLANQGNLRGPWRMVADHSVVAGLVRHARPSFCWCLRSCRATVASNRKW
jgi:hypothetical protein